MYRYVSKYTDKKYYFKKFKILTSQLIILIFSYTQPSKSMPLTHYTLITMFSFFYIFVWLIIYYFNFLIIFHTNASSTTPFLLCSRGTSISLRLQFHSSSSLLHRLPCTLVLAHFAISYMM